MDLIEHILKKCSTKTLWYWAKSISLNFANLAAYRSLINHKRYLRFVRVCMKIRCKCSCCDNKSCLTNLAVISSKFLIPYRGFDEDYRSGQSDYQQLVNQVNVVNRVLTMKLTDFAATSAVIITKQINFEIIKGGEIIQDKKTKKWKRRGSCGNNWRNNSWEVWVGLGKNERRMSSKINTFALMQKCKIIQRRATERQNLHAIVAKTWAKQIYHRLTT